MTTATLEQNLIKVERLGGNTRAMMADIRNELEQNKFMSPEAARTSKLGMFATGALIAAAGVVGLVAAPVIGLAAAPVLTVAAVAAGAALVVGGQQLQNRAEYKHEARAKLTEFLENGQQLMGGLKSAHGQLKEVIQQKGAEAAASSAVRGDFHRLQREVEQNLVSQQSAVANVRESMELSLEGDRPSRGPRMG